MFQYQNSLVIVSVRVCHQEHNHLVDPCYEDCLYGHPLLSKSTGLTYCLH